MFNKYLVIIVSIVTLSLIAPLSYAEDTLSERIIMIGDSQVGGLGPNIKRLIKNFDFVSKRGSKASDWLKPKNHTWSAWIKNTNPRAIIVVLGTNEAVSSTQSQAFARNLQNLCEHLASLSEAIIIWVTPPQLSKPPHLKTIWNASSKIPGIATMDFSDETYELRDGAHLTTREYRRWSADIVKRLP